MEVQLISLSSSRLDLLVMIIGVSLVVLWLETAVPCVRVVGLHPGRWRPGRGYHVDGSAGHLHARLDHWYLAKDVVML